DDVNLPKRKQRKITVFAQRPWYESEMTVKIADKSPELLVFLPDQIDPWTFSIVTQDGRIFEAKFKRKGGMRGDARGLKELGVDFMTAPREDFGRIVKGYLESLGLISYGDPLVQEMLDEAGISHVEFFQIEKDVFLLNF
ncbi:hypothetical protein OAV16_01540, partial [Luminiphilus sp.]|nr:hypothetical protein [Luminiphilus sp.]